VRGSQYNFSFRDGLTTTVRADQGGGSAFSTFSRWQRRKGEYWLRLLAIRAMWKIEQNHDHTVNRLTEFFPERIAKIHELHLANAFPERLKARVAQRH
jgi:hypothetical protein